MHEGNDLLRHTIFQAPKDIDPRLQKIIDENIAAEKEKDRQDLAAKKDAIRQRVRNEVIIVEPENMTKELEEIDKEREGEIRKKIAEMKG